MWNALGSEEWELRPCEEVHTVVVHCSKRASEVEAEEVERRKSKM